MVGFAGNHTERKLVLDCTLKLEREWGNYNRVALTLNTMSNSNRILGYEEGMDQAKGVSKIYGRTRETVNQGDSLIKLAFLLYDDGRILGDIFAPRAEERRPLAISRQPSESQPPHWEDELIITHSPSRFSAKTILMVHMLTSNEPSRTPSITRTSWAVACRRRVLSTVLEHQST